MGQGKVEKQDRNAGYNARDKKHGMQEDLVVRVNTAKKKKKNYIFASFSLQYNHYNYNLQISFF